MARQTVHMLMYNDPKASYVGCDVYAAFSRAREEFLDLLRIDKESHPHDDDYIEEEIDEEGVLYFRDRDGYEVVYREEIVQE